MHLIRILLLCSACLAAALSPARASVACPMQAQAGLVHASPTPAHRHRSPRSCPAPMACCAPMAAHLTAPAVALVRTWHRQPRAIVLHDRSPEDAAGPRLLRPPMPA